MCTRKTCRIVRVKRFTYLALAGSTSRYNTSTCTTVLYHAGKQQYQLVHVLVLIYDLVQQEPPTCMYVHHVYMHICTCTHASYRPYNNRAYAWESAILASYPVGAQLVLRQELYRSSNTCTASARSYSNTDKYVLAVLHHVNHVCLLRDRPLSSFVFP